MAILDTERDVYVVRIVYDGPPFAGKTTTLHALSSSLDGDVQTPGEHDGRTLFFDWLDYTAGRFEGRAIRCQIVSVPGQRSLGARRRKLLSQADAVVFVADTGRLGLELSLKYARELEEALGQMQQPRPGVVVQANKRDVEDVLPLTDVVEEFRNIGVEAAFIESTATTGIGIRESFLLGVRLALDRVRALAARGELQSGRPEIDSSEELMQQLTAEGFTASAPPNTSVVVPTARADESNERAEKAASDGDLANDAVRADEGSATGDDETRRMTVIVERSTSSNELVHGVLSEAMSSEVDAPAQVASASPSHANPALGGLPDPNVPSGYIWPPVEGRVITQQALAGELPKIKVLSSGNFFASSRNGWGMHSRAEDVFEEQSEGRAALIAWARLHALNKEFLSERRCVILSPCESGWRLWQIIGKTKSLRDVIDACVKTASARELAAALSAAAKKLLAAQESFARASVDLTPHFASVAWDADGPRYIGILPRNHKSSSDVEREPRTPGALLASQLHALTRRWPNNVDLSAVAALVGAKPATGEGAALAEALAKIVARGRAA